jgi:DNA-binding response OmpR family regulator
MSTVLFVEDDAVIAQLVDEALEAAGHDVMWAADAHEAAAIADRADRRIEALLTDIHLGPGPSGVEVARLARAKRPDLPVIFVTAHPEGELVTEVPGAVIVCKPFVASQLVAMVGAIAA